MKRLWFKFEMRRAILDGKKTSTTREHPLSFGEHLAVSGSRFHAKPFAVLEIRDRFPTKLENVVTMFYKEEGFTSPEDMTDFLKRNKLLTNDVPVYFHVFRVVQTIEPLKCGYKNCCVKWPKDCPSDGQHGDLTEDYSCLLFPPEFEESN